MERTYFIGLRRDFKLKVDENDILSYEYKERKIINRSKIDDVQQYINVLNSENDVVKQLDEDGSRWEGDWNNEKPFGFGGLYDGDGNRIYSGFMFEGKKIGFGEEYFSDNHKVDYCGTFMNDLRHGWGTKYDRNGNKLFEGEWRCGKNNFENDKIVIEDKYQEDCLNIHDSIKELEIGEGCYNKWKCDLVIENYPNLEKIIVKNYSLRRLRSLKICNCDELKSIEIKDGESLGENDNGAFANVKKVKIESIF